MAMLGVCKYSDGLCQNPGKTLSVLWQWSARTIPKQGACVCVCVCVMGRGSLAQFYKPTSDLKMVLNKSGRALNEYGRSLHCQVAAVAHRLASPSVKDS